MRVSLRVVADDYEMEIPHAAGEVDLEQVFDTYDDMSSGLLLTRPFTPPQYRVKFTGRIVGEWQLRVVKPVEHQV